MFQRVSQASKKDSNVLYHNYDTIPLKIYLRIIETNNLSLLVVTGKQDETVSLVWETITRENEQHNGGNTYSMLLEHFQSLGELVSEYNQVRVMLWALLKKCNREYIAVLEELGFTFDLTDSATYKESLLNAIARSRNYETKIRSKRNEIESEIPDDQQKTEQPTFEELMANLTMHLKFNLPDDLTLSRFNAYQKEIKRHGRGTRPDKEE